MKLLIIHSEDGPDYLADLFFSEIMHNTVADEIATNHLPAYLFDDWPAPTKLYGRGYSVFAKIPSIARDRVTVLTEQLLRDQIVSRYFDFVIYTSIWRNHHWIFDVLRAYDKSRVIVLDGEDHAKVLSIAPRVRYYKRELLASFEDICLPISFSFPLYYKPQIEASPVKQYLLAPCVPVMLKSYVFQTEASYYQQYAQYYFALTAKKGGWDCMRHYEIIRAGCIPYFPDIEGKPELTMANYAVGLQYRANALFEFCVKNPSSIEKDRRVSLQRLQEDFDQWLQQSGGSDQYAYLLTEP